MTEAAGPDWERIRAEYEAGEILIADILAAHNVKLNQLNYRRRKEHWTLRMPVTSQQQGRNLLRRMLDLIESQIARLEQKFSEEPMSAAEMRMLETMTKAIDRIAAREAAERKVASKPMQMDPELAAIRDRLVQRIEELDVQE